MAIDQIRMVLIIALCVVSFLLWDAWQRDYGPKPPPPASVDRPAPDAAPSESTSPSTDVPQAPQAVQPAPAATPTSDDLVAESGRGRKITVTTDVLSVQIDSLGGTIAGVDLLSYPVSNDKPNEPFRLLDDTDPVRFFTAQSGLTGPRSAPNHHAQYESEADAYELTGGLDFIEVPLRWRSQDGVEVTRTYRFASGSLRRRGPGRRRQSERFGLARCAVRPAPARRTGKQWRDFPHLHIHGRDLVRTGKSRTRRSTSRTWRARTSIATSAAAGWR